MFTRNASLSPAATSRREIDGRRDCGVGNVLPAFGRPYLLAVERDLGVDAIARKRRGPAGKRLVGIERPRLGGAEFLGLQHPGAGLVFAAGHPVEVELDGFALPCRHSLRNPGSTTVSGSSPALANVTHSRMMLEPGWTTYVFVTRKGFRSITRSNCSSPCLSFVLFGANQRPGARRRR